jgi:hypothetical protein
MSRTIIFCFLLLTLFFISCRKKETSSIPACTSDPHPIPDFERQFIFKSPGYWIFKNVASNAKDSIYMLSTTITHTAENGTKDCPDLHTWDIAIVKFKHNLFSPSYLETYYQINMYYDHTRTMGMGTNPSSMNSGYSIFDKSIGDSMQIGSVTSKIENKYSNLTVNGINYTDVYLMRYTPDNAGFKRIWWVKGVGFVRLEFVNPSTMLTETWELERKSIQLAL